MTTREEIRARLLTAKELGASHLIIVCDTFDWSDYPVYMKVIPETEEERIVDRLHYVWDVRKAVQVNYSGQNMQKMMEVYNLGLPIEEQIATERCYNY